MMYRYKNFLYFVIDICFEKCIMVCKEGYLGIVNVMEEQIYAQGSDFFPVDKRHYN